MQGAKCAINKLMYGLSVCTEDNHSLNLVAYHLVHMDEPYINLHVHYIAWKFAIYKMFVVYYWV